MLTLCLIIAAFNLDFYTDVQDLSYLQHHLDQDPRSAKYRCDVLCGDSLPANLAFVSNSILMICTFVDTF